MYRLDLYNNPKPEYRLDLYNNPKPEGFAQRIG